MYKWDLERQKNQRSNCQHPLDHRKKQKNSRKISTSTSLTMLEPLLCESQLTVEILKELGTPDHLTCLLRNLYQDKKQVRTRHGTTDWFQIGKVVCQAVCCHIMRNAGLNDSQTRIKIGGRNINNLRYADDTILMAESKEELKSFLMRMKEKNENAGLKLNIQNTKIITSWQIDREQVETVTNFIFLGSRITADNNCSHEIKRCLLLGRKTMTNLDDLVKQREQFPNRGPYSQSYDFFQ